MFTIAPKGRGWSVTVVGLESLEPEYHLTERDTETRDRRWRTLRKRIQKDARQTR